MKRRYSPVPYHNLWLRTCLALLATHFLMFYGDDRTFWQAVHTKIYYISFIENFLLSLFLIWIVHTITKLLDYYFDWQWDTFLRIVLQTIFGMVFPIVLAIWLATFFYAFNGMDINETDYFSFVFPLIKIMVIGLNIYYFGHYFYLTRYKPVLDGTIPYSKPLITFGRQTLVNDEVWQKKQLLYKSMEGFMLSHKNEEADNQHSLSEDIWVNFNTTHLKFNIASEICFFHSEDSSTNIYTHSGRNFKVKYALCHYEELYHGKLFFQINRSTLININVIRGYKSGANRTLILILELPFTPNEKLMPEIITVSREKTAELKTWLQK